MSTKPNRNYFNLSLKEGCAERKERGWKECERERGREREGGRRKEERDQGSNCQYLLMLKRPQTDLTRLFV